MSGDKVACYICQHFEEWVEAPGPHVAQLLKSRGYPDYMIEADGMPSTVRICPDCNSKMERELHLWLDEK